MSGFEPEGLSLVLWGPDSVLISWSTGGELSRWRLLPCLLLSPSAPPIYLLADGTLS